MDMLTCTRMGLVTYKPRHRLFRGRTDNINDWVKNFGQFKLDDSMKEDYQHVPDTMKWNNDGLSKELQMGLTTEFSNHRRGLDPETT